MVLKEAKNTTKGAYVKWSKLSGASKYYIYRRSITGSKWTKVGTVSSKKTTFTDTSVKNKNGNYIYSVKAVNKKCTKSRMLYAGLTCLFAKTPVMNSVSVISNNTIQVKWGSTKSGAKYNVMRKEPGGSWATIATNYSGTTYNDKTAVNGKKYTYSVKAVISTSYGKATSSYYANNDKVVTYLKAPTLNSVTKSENGPNIKWSAVACANTYKICRMPLDKSESWRLVGTVGSGTLTFTDKTASADGSYIYTVRADSAKNKGSYYSAGIEHVVLDKPVVEVEATTDNEIKISWNEIPYATDCEIYCRTVGGEWELLAVVDSTSLNYLYDLNKYGDFEVCVRATRRNQIFSEYSNVVVYHQDAKVIVTSVPFADGIELGWKDHGYDSYNIYRRLSTQTSSEDVLIATVTGNIFKDTTVENDISYTYKVVGVVDGEENSKSIGINKIGIRTNTAPPSVPKAMVLDGVLTQYWDDYVAYAYNYKYEYWEYIEFGKTKEYYKEYLKDNKIKFAYSEAGYSNLSTPIDSTISEKEWFDNKIDYTVKVKNKDITIVCKSLGDNIEAICVDHGFSYLHGEDSKTIIISLDDDDKYFDLEISIYTFEKDCATIKERIYLE